jgi:hypothetical protein
MQAGTKKAPCQELLQLEKKLEAGLWKVGKLAVLMTHHHQEMVPGKDNEAQL